MIRRHFTWAASTTLPTKYGECITSEVSGSLKCDCKDQLGLPDDARTYDVAALMLEYLEIEARIPHQLPSLALPLAGAGGTRTP